MLQAGFEARRAGWCRCRRRPRPARPASAADAARCLAGASGEGASAAASADGPVAAGIALGTFAAIRVPSRATGARRDAETVSDSSVQIATRTPSSTTRSLGMRKNSVAEDGVARHAAGTARSRHSGSRGTIAGTSVSRPRK